MDSVVHGTDRTAEPVVVAPVTPAVMQPRWRVELMRHGPHSEQLVEVAVAVGSRDLTELMTGWLALNMAGADRYLYATRLADSQPMLTPLVEYTREPQPMVADPLPSDVSGYALGRRVVT